MFCFRLNKSSILQRMCSFDFVLSDAVKVEYHTFICNVSCMWYHQQWFVFAIFSHSWSWQQVFTNRTGPLRRSKGKKHIVRRRPCVRQVTYQWLCFDSNKYFQNSFQLCYKLSKTCCWMALLICMYKRLFIKITCNKAKACFNVNISFPILFLSLSVISTYSLKTCALSHLHTQRHH